MTAERSNAPRLRQDTLIASLNDVANGMETAAPYVRELCKEAAYHLAAMPSDTRDRQTRAYEEVRDRILAERDKGNLVFWALDELACAPIAEFVEQPAEGILYDLNRSEEISLSFINERKWVNDFAVALTIRKLVAQRDEARKQLAAVQNNVATTGLTCQHGVVGYCEPCALRDPGEAA